MNYCHSSSNFAMGIVGKYMVQVCQGPLLKRSHCCGGVVMLASWLSFLVYGNSGEGDIQIHIMQLPPFKTVFGYPCPFLYLFLPFLAPLHFYGIHFSQWILKNMYFYSFPLLFFSYVLFFLGVVGSFSFHLIDLLPVIGGV